MNATIITTKPVTEYIIEERAFCILEGFPAEVINLIPAMISVITATAPAIHYTIDNTLLSTSAASNL